MIKRLVNLAGSMVLHASDWVGDLICRFFGRTPQSKCVVLAYHSIPAKQRAQFVGQMDMLLRGAKPVHVDIPSLPARGEHYVGVTFDDALEDILVNALPELKKRGIPCTVFAIAGMLGRKRTWEHLGGEDTSEVNVMSQGQLRELPSELVKIGSHSMTHPFLPKLDREMAREEIVESRAALEKLLNSEVKLFAFPYGQSSENLNEDCRGAGYTRVFTGLPVLAFSQPSEFVTGRVVASPTDWPIEFRLKVAGAYRWLPSAFALKRRVLLLVRGTRRETVHA